VVSVAAQGSLEVSAGLADGQRGDEQPWNARLGAFLGKGAGQAGAGGNARPDAVEHASGGSAAAAVAQDVDALEQR